MEIYVKDNKALTLDSKFLSPAASGETWVLNKSPNVSVDMEFAISFISNGKEFVKLVVNSMKESIKYRGETTNVPVFVYANWANEAYRTLTFAQPVTDSTLLAWLQANAVKQ